MRCQFRSIRRAWFAAVAATALTLVLICYADIFFSRESDRLTLPKVQRRHERVKNMVYRLKSSAQILPGDAVSRMQERRQRVTEVCRKYNLGRHQSPHSARGFPHPPTPQYEAFYFDRDHRLAFCPLYKSASSSWLMTLSMLHNISMEHIEHSGKQLSEVARSVVPSLGGSEAIQAMGESLRFMIVRNPFERILSAYRDKLENRKEGLTHGTEHFYQTYGKEIVRNYRNTRIHPELTNRDEPTFPEFIQYLIDTDLVQRADDHWIPYYLFCTPCWVDYDVIAKFETLQDDFEFLIQVAELDKYGVQPPWRHLTKGVRSGDVDSAYYAQITKEQVLELYEKYKLDFELFDYDFDKYFDIAK